MEKMEMNLKVATTALCEKIIFAEFDIDKGSMVRQWYPMDEIETESGKDGKEQRVYIQSVGYTKEFFADMMLPEGVHNQEQDFTMFFLHQNPHMKGESGLISCLNVVKTKYDASLRRGATVKALAMCSKYQHCFAFKKLLEAALDSLLKDSEVDSALILAKVYNSINSIDVNLFNGITEADRRFWRRTTCERPLGHSRRNTNNLPEPYATNVPWENITIPICINMLNSEDQHERALLTPLLQKFGARIMRIYNAALTGGRIVVLGHNRPAGDVCDYVLSISALLSPPLLGLAYRQYPYANLTDLSYLTTPGYIAGVTNPMFKGKTEWWDVLCDICSGEVLFATNNKEGGEEYDTVDKEFITKVLQGMRSGLGEEWIRMMFYEYTSNLVEIAFGDAIFTDTHAQVRSLAINNKRITKWARTSSYKLIQEERSNFKHTALAFNVKASGVDLKRHIRRLRSGSINNEMEVDRIYTDFISLIHSEADLKEFLSYLPESFGGLHLVAEGLFHSLSSVQYHTVVILNRLECFESTRSAVQDMNTFYLMAYQRVGQLVSPLPVPQK